MPSGDRARRENSPRHVAFAEHAGAEQGADHDARFAHRRDEADGCAREGEEHEDVGQRVQGADRDDGPRCVRQISAAPFANGASARAISAAKAQP